MNLNTFRRHVDKVALQDDLAIKYLQATNENIEDIITDMHQLMSRNNIQDNDIDMVLRNSIKLAIDTQTSVLDILSMNDRIPTDITSNIGRFFDDVGRVYERNNNDMNIEYCPENRDKLIEMNIKTVVYIAKQFRNKGVDFEDLIGAGNVGLCLAFDRFKPNNKLTNKLESIIDSFDSDSVDGSEILNSMSSVVTYGGLNKSLSRSFKPGKKYTKKDMRAWVNKNVRSARFNSVAMMWIRACILQEIKNSTLVHRPDSVRRKSKEETGVYNPDTYVSLDKPIATDSETTLENFLESPEEVSEILDNQDTMTMIRTLLGKLLKGVSTRDRRIFLKKFGIGLPRPMQPKEIAEQEDLSIARVSQIFQQVMQQIRDNADNLNLPQAEIDNLMARIG